MLLISAPKNHFKSHENQILEVCTYYGLLHRVLITPPTDSSTAMQVRRYINTTPCTSKTPPSLFLHTTLTLKAFFPPFPHSHNTLVYCTAKELTSISTTVGTKLANTPGPAPSFSVRNVIPRRRIRRIT